MMIKQLHFKFKLKCKITSYPDNQLFIIKYNSMVIDIDWFYI